MKEFLTKSEHDTYEQLVCGIESCKSHESYYLVVYPEEDVSNEQLKNTLVNILHVLHQEENLSYRYFEKSEDLSEIIKKGLYEKLQDIGSKDILKETYNELLEVLNNIDADILCFSYLYKKSDNESIPYQKCVAAISYLYKQSNKILCFVMDSETYQATVADAGVSEFLDHAYDVIIIGGDVGKH